MGGERESVLAAVFDYGGVITTQGRRTIDAWLAADGIRPESFSRVIKAWLSRKAPEGTPIHRLETGELPASAFEKLFAAELRTLDGSPVPSEGLLERFFAAGGISQPMVDLVRGLRASGIITALLSNSWGNRYPAELLTELFDTVVISGQVGLRKPDPRIYRLTLERIGVPAGRAVFVDDGEPNIEAAVQLGMHAVLHDDPATTMARIAELVPQLEIDLTRRSL
ncbi:MAG: HAD family hydrolase [Sciscionella sp.]